MKERSTNVRTYKKHLYYTVWLSVSHGRTFAQICEERGITKQKLNYYLSSLTKKGFLNRISYGVYEVPPKITKNEVQILYKPLRAERSPVVFKERYSGGTISGGVRGHGFAFMLRIPAVPNWARRTAFFRSKGLNYKKVSFGGVAVKYGGLKLHLYERAIRFYLPRGFMRFGDSAGAVEKNVFREMYDYIRKLETFLGTSLKFASGYELRVYRNHYGHIKNELAKRYNRQNRGLQVRDEMRNNELWLVIDDSFTRSAKGTRVNWEEIETVSRSARADSDDVLTPFFNRLRRNPDILEIILQNQNFNTNSIKAVLLILQKILQK